MEEILKHFQGSLIEFAQVAKDANEGKIAAAFVTGGYPPQIPAFAESEVIALKNVGMLIVQDFFRSPLTENARYVLPATAFPEKSGTFVNHANLAQTITRASHPPQEARTEGQVYLDLMSRHGLIQAAAIRREMAAETPFFAPLANDLGGLGIRLGS